MGHGKMGDSEDEYSRLKVCPIGSAKEPHHPKKGPATPDMTNEEGF